MSPRRGNRWVDNLPGWSLMAVLAGLSLWISKGIVIGGKNPVEAVLLAILLGMLVANVGRVPQLCQSGVQKFEQVLAIAIVLLGLGLNLRQLIDEAAEALIVVSVCVIVAPLLILALGRSAGLPAKLAMLIGVGTTICGGTAIAISAPIIKARDEDVSYAIATIALFGLAAIFVYPLIGSALGLSSQGFGLWAGTAIHSTPQVLAAGFLYDDAAGPVATIAKLFRNLFLLPAVVVMGVLQARSLRRSVQEQGAAAAVAKPTFRSVVPWFVVWFFAMVVVRTVMDTAELLPPDVWASVLSTCVTCAKILLVTAMAGIGLRTNFAALTAVGIKPFAVGFAASVLLGVLSLFVTWLVV